MPELKTYTVVINGVERQMQLSEDDAERYGATEAKATAATTKARTAQNKSRKLPGGSASDTD